MSKPEPIAITPEQLSPATLRNVIEEFVTRDGTELSDVEAKVDAVRDQLRAGEVRLWFDPETATCNIVRT